MSLVGYGVHGLNVVMQFDAVRVSLLNRGLADAVAHVRGGSDLERTCYDGKMHKKMNTFNDFIACGLPGEGEVLCSRAARDRRRVARRGRAQPAPGPVRRG